PEPGPERAAVLLERRDEVPPLRVVLAPDPAAQVQRRGAAVPVPHALLGLAQHEAEPPALAQHILPHSLRVDVPRLPGEHLVEELQRLARRAPLGELARLDRRGVARLAPPGQVRQLVRHVGSRRERAAAEERAGPQEGSHEGSILRVRAQHTSCPRRACRRMRNRAFITSASSCGRPAMPKASCSRRYSAKSSSYRACAAGDGACRCSILRHIARCASATSPKRPAATAPQIAAPSAQVSSAGDTSTSVPSTSASTC